MRLAQVVQKEIINVLVVEQDGKSQIITAHLYVMIFVKSVDLRVSVYNVRLDIPHMKVFVFNVTQNIVKYATKQIYVTNVKQITQQIYQLIYVIQYVMIIVQCVLMLVNVKLVRQVIQYTKADVFIVMLSFVNVVMIQINVNFAWINQLDIRQIYFKIFVCPSVVTAVKNVNHQVYVIHVLQVIH